MATHEGGGRQRRLHLRDGPHGQSRENGDRARRILNIILGISAQFLTFFVRNSSGVATFHDLGLGILSPSGADCVHPRWPRRTPAGRQTYHLWRGAQRLLECFINPGDEDPLQGWKSVVVTAHSQKGIPINVSCQYRSRYLHFLLFQMLCRTFPATQGVCLQRGAYLALTARRPGACR